MYDASAIKVFFFHLSCLFFYISWMDQQHGEKNFNVIQTLKKQNQKLLVCFYGSNLK